MDAEIEAVVEFAGLDVRGSEVGPPDTDGPPVDSHGHHLGLPAPAQRGLQTAEVSADFYGVGADPGVGEVVDVSGLVGARADGGGEHLGGREGLHGRHGPRRQNPGGSRLDMRPLRQAVAA
ncbi:hypothetical protein GCM10017750_69100 [Streptomyces racemochromogenes]